MRMLVSGVLWVNSVIAGMVFEAFLRARGKPFPCSGFRMARVVSDTGPMNRWALVSNVLFLFGTYK